MDIEIVGRHALLFDDDTTAAFVNSQDALVEWNSLLIDRYDVRHLLDSPPPSRRRRNPQTSHSSPADAEIDYERYLDLPSPSEEEETDVKPEPVGGFNAVPFSYGNYEDSNDQKNAEAEPEAPGFHPPFPVPDSLIHNLPPTEKVHQIISRTALFVSKNGGQSEIILRVKQGDNPTFGFLMPDHHLHPYFRFLVNHKDLLQSTEEKTSNNTGALSLLGSVYGTGEDDDGETETHHASSSGKDDKTILPAGKDESVSNHSVPVKEDSFILKKNTLPNAMKVGKISSVKKGESSSLQSAIRASSLPPIPKSEHMVLDPSSEMKTLVDKIVEFIIKNGRQFEGVLMEQDRGHGRFPFLVPSNIFHPYYLKVLQKAEESKLTVKSFHNDKEDFKGHGNNRKTSRVTENFSMESDDIPLESDRKEKFKMVINKSKKETSDPPSKPTEQPIGVQVDAAQAAAILQAATRGIKPPNLGFLNGKFVGQSQSQSQSQPSNVNEADSNEQKLKAERLKRAKMFVAMLKSGTAPSRGVSAEPQVSDKKIKSEKEYLDEEKRAKRKYRDRSSVHDDDNDDDNDDDEREEKRSHRHRKKKHRSHESEERYERKRSTSRKHDDMDEKDEKRDHKRKKKHRSSSSDEEDEVSRRKHRSHESEERYERKHRTSHKHDDVDEKDEEKDHRRKKKHRSSSSDEEDEVSKRKHRSYESEERFERKHRTQRKYDDDMDEKDEKRDHKRKKKHRSSSSDEEDEHSRRKHYEGETDDDEHSRRKHRSHKSSSHRHKHHRRIHSSKHREKNDGKGSNLEKGDLEDEEVSLKLSGQSKDREASVDESSSFQENKQKASEVTEVPDELRAKIRAMLMSTM